MNLETRPLIAVNGLLLTEKKQRLALDMRYSDAVWQAGGFPVPISPLADEAYVEQLLDRVQGVLLTGGDDFDTERIGLGPTHPSADVTPTAKQDFDLDLTARILERNMPVLGVCYGMQLLGLSAGAQMLQHLPEDRPGCQEHSGGIEHPVLLQSGTKLGQVMGVSSVPVVSRHHQALHQIPAPWTVCAQDEQGLVEAIELPGHIFAIGVQWHPEASPTEGPHGQLFRALTDAARGYALSSAY
jgi:putative glutamine amidotransferase